MVGNRHVLGMCRWHRHVGRERLYPEGPPAGRMTGALARESMDAWDEKGGRFLVATFVTPALDFRTPRTEGNDLGGGAYK